MKVTMDRAGRVVLPKLLRDQLGLEPDEEFDIAIEGSGIRLQPRPRAEREITLIGGWPVISAAGSRTISDADVRALRDGDQR